MRYVTILLTVGMLSAFNDSRCGCLAKVNVPVDVYHRNPSNLEILRHALNHDSKWEYILKEKLKTRALVRLGAKNEYDPLVSVNILDDENSFVNVRNMIHSIVYTYQKLGTMADYGARVLFMSMTCNIVRHMTFQANYVSRLIDLKIDADLIMSELTNIKQVIVMFMEKLAASDLDMSLVNTLHWEMLSLMQYDMVHRARGENYPENSNIHLKNLQPRFVGYLEENCAPYEPTVAFFMSIGIDHPGMLLTDNVLKTMESEEMLLKAGKAHRQYLNELYNKLGVDSLPRDLWSQIFYTGKKLLPTDEADETNAAITHVIPVVALK